MIDPFALQKAFPDSRDLLLRRQASLDEVKSTAQITIDASVLLQPYGLDLANINTIGSIYRRLRAQERLFVSGQAIREFMVHRDEKIASLLSHLRELKKKQSPMKNSSLASQIDAYKDAKKIFEEVRSKREEFSKKIDSAISEVNDWVDHDPLLDIYREVFPDIIVELSADSSEMQKVLEERMVWRKQNKIPPGFEDTRFGDEIIWETILEVGEHKKCDMIFVTHDDKVDWRRKFGEASIGPRRELVDEYSRRTGGKNICLIGITDLVNNFEADSTKAKRFTHGVENAAKQEEEDRRRSDIEAEIAALKFSREQLWLERGSFSQQLEKILSESGQNFMLPWSRHAPGIKATIMEIERRIEQIDGRLKELDATT